MSTRNSDNNNSNFVFEEAIIDEFFMHLKIENKYDSNNNLIESKNSQWDYTNNEFYYWWKKDYTYTNDSIKTKCQYSLWNKPTLTWDLNSEYRYSYNSNSDLQYKEYSKKDNENDSLVLQKRIEYVYNDDGEINTLWNSMSSQWVNLTKLEFSKNENNKLTYEADFTGDSLSADSIIETEENHINDSKGKLKKHNFSTKDSLSNQLIEEWSKDCSYDLAVSFSGIIYPPECEYRHTSKLTGLEQYSNLMLQKSYAEIIDNQLATTEVLTFFYTLEDETEITDFISVNELKVYPNLASEYVVFDIGNTRQSTFVELYYL